MAVWSPEPIRDAHETGAPAEEETYSRGRVRAPLPSIIFGPAAFGLAAAHHVVSMILKEGVEKTGP
jgi:tRNA A37 threonylcarbamoyladenosine dehydratase